MKGTRGTETSKYPEEEKETSIFLVAASERGRAQTMLRHGVVDHHKSQIIITEYNWKVEPQKVKVL